MSEKMLSALLLLAVAASPLLVQASVQTPTLTSCSSSEKVVLSDVTIQNAQIGQKMTANFSLTINEPLKSKPKLQVTLTKQDGRKVNCISHMGSCKYDLCRKDNIVEETLSKSWGNTCPVPATTLQETVDVVLPTMLKFIIGNPPTTLTVKLEVTNDEKTVGCQSFKFHIAAA
ncbi:uncharacterized protein LOC119401685 [Rhipicephalus sanguineus]|uniref:uncharacterized protein LOC119401685 n=1 Tax=Rhipicephalus sanguineus TaxID=34632 RepID=UPI001893CE24|nr:uncharacterized protein LOC119401685 [Rhipicephalus sanguineus]